MDTLKRYSKELAAGSFVLLWVLGAPSTAQAAVPVPEDFVATFSGTASVGGSVPGETASFGFTASDLTTPSAHFVMTSDATVTVPQSSQTEAFTFTGEFIGGNQGDNWQLFPDQSSFSSSSGNNVVSFFGSGGGNFVFDNVHDGVVPNVNANFANFSFTIGDPISVNFTKVSSGTSSPLVAGAPEVDASSATAPLALLAATVALALDRRRYRSAS